jgi:hypothetical protein
MTGSPPVVTAVSPQSFASSWEQYLELLEAVGRRQLRRNESQPFRQSFLPIYNKVFDSLRSRRSLDSIEAAVEAAVKDAASTEAIAFLMDELEAYNDWWGPTVAADPVYQVDRNDHSLEAIQKADTSRKDETAHGVSAGKTIKDSLESLLGKWLKGPVRKALGIVNELLSIIRGGS